MTRLCKEISATLDEHIRQTAEGKVGPDEDKKNLQMNSVLMASCTPAALFERLSGGFKLVSNAGDFQDTTLKEVLHLGRMLNIDEVYSHFADLGLTTESRRKTNAPTASTVNEF